MIKKIIFIIVLIFLLAISILAIWIRISPESFLGFIKKNPTIYDVTTQVGVLKPQVDSLLLATSSEPVLGLSGQITIGKESWDVEIASSESSQINGLSNRKTLYKKNGMLFVFDSLGSRSFWMKDMLIPIDMIFFDDKWKIVLVESNLQPSSFPQVFGREVKSQYVLEINALESEIYGLKVGDQAIFLNK